jgi:hypothetical protein
MLDWFCKTTSFPSRDPLSSAQAYVRRRNNCFPLAAPLQALQSVDYVIEVPLGRSLRAKDSVQSSGPWYRLFVLATSE